MEQRVFFANADVRGQRRGDNSDMERKGMTDIEREALYNEIEFLQKEVDKYREQNKKIINLIIILKHDKRAD